VAPMTSVLLQRDGARLVVIDEIVLERATTEEACQEFDNRYKDTLRGSKFSEMRADEILYHRTERLFDVTELAVPGRFPGCDVAGSAE
jgi:hypothetical protein